jgi:hypothetical protein
MEFQRTPTDRAVIPTIISPSPLGRVRILIKIRSKLKFDRFTMEKMSNSIFNRILMSIRTRPYCINNISVLQKLFRNRAFI